MAQELFSDYNTNIIGIGIDIISISHIKRRIDVCHALVKKALTYNEYNIFQNRHDFSKYTYFAKRWAAKEAIFKAMPSDVCSRLLRFVNLIEICSDSDHKPYVRIVDQETTNKLSLRYEAFDIKISLSHNNDYATAFCVITGLKRAVAKNQ